MTQFNPLVSTLHKVGKFVDPSNTIPTVASATSIVTPKNVDVFYISGTTTIANIDADQPIKPGRIITILPTASFTITHTAFASKAKGKINGGSGDISCTATDTQQFVCDETGYWRRIAAIAVNA